MTVIFLKKKKGFTYVDLKGRMRERGEWRKSEVALFPSTGSYLKCLQQPRLSQAEARRRILSPIWVAGTLVLAITLPPRVCY